MLVTITYTSLIPNIQAAESTPYQKVEIISKDVVGLNLTDYVKTIQESPSDSYLGVIPQENIRYTLNSNDGKVDIHYTFADGKLRKIHVLKSEGSPSLTKTATNTIETAKDFLSSYQDYSGDSFYAELGAMLNNVDAGNNLTKTSGNTKLEVTNSEGYEIFKWTYMFNNIEAPDKCVALGYKNGFLKYFLDNWALYEIGSTTVNLSEEEAIDIALERSGTFSWRMGTDDNISEVKNFHITNAMIWETVFLSNIHADTPRSQDPLMLYPIQHVWVSLDKFYPGNVHGINVYVWADTGNIAYIHERVSSLDPPADLVATMDDFTVEAVNDKISTGASQFDVLSITWFALPAFAFAVLGIVPVWLAKKKLPKRGFLKICGILFCVLISSTMLLGQVSTVSAASQNECIEIWGSESAGAYGVPPNNASWRKTTNEIDCQDQVSYLIDVYFSDYNHGYHAYDNQGDDSVKSMILDDISYAEANYPRVAVVAFDHGMGRDDYQGLDEFHFMFEDNIGTGTGPPNAPQWVANNGVYDMDIYPRTALGKVVFAFINTCGSANLTNLETGQAWQGLMPETDRARGMPFAWTRRVVGSEMSSNGYSAPDSGDCCYIGFPYGSASLSQTTSGGGTKHWLWVRDFFWHASNPGNSINNALDDASLDNCGVLFSYTALANYFNAAWPMYNYTSQQWETPYFPNCKMVVYGNGNIHLYRNGGIWHLDGNADDDLHDNDGTIYGATSTTGKFSSALSFDGVNDYVNIPYDFSLDDFDELTISCWIYPTALADGYYRQIINKGWQNTGAFVMYLDNDLDRVYFATLDSGGQKSAYASIGTGEWYHVVGVFKKGEPNKIYVNGVRGVDSSATEDETLSLNYAVRIALASNDFEGAIDEVRIYDYALSASQIADQAAVASLHLNGGDYAYDSSPYGNTGTVHGASWVTGLRTSSGYSLASSFNGNDDYVEVPSSPSLRVSNAVTIAAWIKISRKSGDSSDQIIVSKNGYDYILNVFGTGRGANVGKIEVGGNALSPAWLVGSTVVDDDKWHYIVFTYNGSMKKIYVDGALDAYASTSGSFASTTGALRIGRQPSGDARQVDGVIDEVRIYDRALSANEISIYYDANVPYYWLTVACLYNDYYPIYSEIKIDGQGVGYCYKIEVVAQGNHVFEVEDWVEDPNYGWFYFDHYTYGSTTNYNNPMTLSVSEDTYVSADYFWYGW